MGKTTIVTCVRETWKTERPDLPSVFGIGLCWRHRASPSRAALAQRVRRAIGEASSTAATTACRAAVRYRFPGRSYGEHTMTNAPPEREDILVNEFNRTVGECIIHWAFVEEELFMICWRVLKCALEHAAIIYYRTPNLKARLSFAEDLMESVLPKTTPGKQHHPDKKRWKGICKEFRSLLKARNRIAHHPVWPTWRLFEDSRIDISGFEIYVGEHERLRGREIEPPLRIDDLKRHRVSTNKLVARLIQFREIATAHAQAFVSQGLRPIPR